MEGLREKPPLLRHMGRSQVPVPRNSCNVCWKLHGYRCVDPPRCRQPWWRPQVCRIVEPHATYKGERLGDDDLCGFWMGWGGWGMKEKSGEIGTFYIFLWCLHVWCCRDVQLVSGSGRLWIRKLSTTFPFFKIDVFFLFGVVSQCSNVFFVQ